MRILNRYRVDARAASIRYAELRPARRNTGIHLQCVAALGEAKNCLQPYAVHPASGARVPRPPAAAEVPFGGIDISCNHVWLDFVLSYCLRRRCVSQWIDHLVEL